MAYTAIGSIAEAGDYEFISVGTKGSVGALVSMELDSLNRIKEHQQQRKTAKSCARVRNETVSVFCDKRMSLNTLVSRKDSSVYVQSPRTPRSYDRICEGRRSGKQVFLSSEVESPVDSCRKKGEGYGLRKSRSQGKHRQLGEKAVHARKSVSDLDEETGAGFIWINTPTRSVKKNRQQDECYQTPLMSPGLIRDFDDDDGVDIERGRRLKSGLSVVEVVDLKCRGIANGNNKVNEKNWGLMSAIATRVMRGLSFSRLKPDDSGDLLV